MTDKLPPGWAWSTLGQVCSHPQYGWTTSAASNGDLRLLRTTDITSGPINWETVPFCAEEPRDPEQYVLADGDIIVSRAGSVGKSYLIRKPERAAFASYLIRFRPSINTEYVAYFLKSGAYWKQISEQTAGIAIPNINGSKLRDIVLPIAPSPEQARIVSKIDELFSHIEEGERALERVQKLVERYRQSVLKAAVTGLLTRDWREKNKGQLESGEALLARILKARREAWEKAELDKMKAKGVTPANDKWKQKYEEPSPPDTTDLPELPAGWLWASVNQLGLVSGGLTKNPKRSEHESKRPYLRVANVYANRLDLAEVHEIGVADSELDRVVLQAGDMLVVEGNGSIDQIGRVALWDGSIEGCVHQNHLIKVRCTQVLPSWYVLIWCLSPLGREQIRRVASSTAGLHTLSISKVQALPVPIPNAEELATILDRFEQMDSLVANQRVVIDREARKSVSLRQSVLRAAFSGSLVPQQPSDEPAQALLGRIAAGRGATPAKPTRGRKNRTKELA